MCAFPGAIQCPNLPRWKLTVTSACTAVPSTSPVDASTPEAMSAATTGASQPLIASIAVSAGARGAPENPVPKTASTITPAPSSAGATSSGPTWRAVPSNRPRFAVASAESSPPGHSRSASTSYPVSASSRAQTSPSPPLLPLPQTTRTGPGRATVRTASATAAPALSIRSSEGTRCSSIAQASAARIPVAS